jgi:hypothetical protein
MTDMEQDYAGQIVDWMMFRFKGIEDISHEDMVNNFWNEYFQSCTMGTPETGLEMPHEEDLSYTYHPNVDEYNSCYGW